MYFYWSTLMFLYGTSLMFLYGTSLLVNDAVTLTFLYLIKAVNNAYYSHLVTNQVSDQNGTN
jgi:tryptophan-rich sensory protein